MKKYFLAICLLLTLIIWGKSLKVISDPGNISITYSIHQDALMNYAMDNDTLLLKHFMLNLPSEGGYLVNIQCRGDQSVNNSKYTAEPLMKYEEILAGRQRMLHITLNPYYADKICEEYIISVDFEKHLSKIASMPVNKSALNSEYSSPLKIAAVDEMPIKKYLKIITEETGIYRIDAEDLLDAGLETSLIDPGKLCLFTADTMLIPPDTPGMFSAMDPVKVPMKFYGDNDHIFEDEEYILFFAESVNGDGKNIYNGYDMYMNPYTKYNAFALELNSDEEPAITLNPELTFDSYTEEINVERIMHYDSLCPLEAGYGWVWKGFDMGPESGDMEYNVNFSAADALSDSGQISVKLFFETDDTFALDFYFNGNLVHSMGTRYHNYTIPLYAVFDVENIADDNTLRIVLKDTDDYYKRMYMDEVRVYYTANTGVSEVIDERNCSCNGITVNSNSNSYIYYKYNNVNYMGKLDAGLSNVKAVYPQRLYIEKTIHEPVDLEYVDNRIYDTKGAQIVVITGQGMKNSVNAYQNYRENQGYSVSVFEIDDIYNTFTLGIENPAAIKALMYYAFANWTETPQYLLLLGAGTYDYREIINSYEKRNIVPVYETGYGMYEQALLTQGSSSMTDRWYCTIVGDDDFIDVIPGRITALNSREAKDALRKIIDYETRMDVSAQNEVIIIADDEYSSRSIPVYTENIFTRNAEYLANVLEGNYHVEKIYLMDYMGDQQTYDEHWPTNPGYKRQVRFDINRKITQGAAVCYYYGHGANYTLAHEHILLYPDDNSFFSNIYNYPIWVLGTCSAAQFDYDEGSIGDAFQKLPYSGFSATLAATRATADGNNVQIIKNIFSEDLINAQYSTIGEYYNSIINTNGQTNTQFVLVGDPAMDMRERINDIIISENDTFLWGTVDTIHLHFNTDGTKIVDFTVYQPEYPDSHDYKHTEPYLYQKFDRNDGIIFKGQYEIYGNEIHIEVPFPDSLDESEKQYYDNFEITAIYTENEELHYGYTRNNYMSNNDDSLVYNYIPEITVKSEGIEISDRISLPSEYRLDIKVTDQFGVYQGNIEHYKPVMMLNDSIIEIDEFVYNSVDDNYSASVIIGSDSNTDSIDISIYNNKFIHCEKSIVIEHMTGLRYFRELTLYPNPAEDYVFISFLSNGGGILTYSLISRNGGIMANKSIPFSDGFNTFKVNLDKGYAGSIPPGIYLLNMEFRYFGRNDVIEQSKKLIKAE